MGCFSSKPARPLQCYTYKEKPGLVDETTTDATVYQGGLTANGYRATQYDIQMQPGYIFAASFAGVFGETAAAYFAKHAFAEYQRALGTTPTNIATALTTTLQHLEARYLADASIPAEVRAHVGASATILIASIPQATCFIATVGAMQCVGVRAMGSFAAGWAEGRLLTQPHTTSNDLERKRVHRNSDASIPADVQSLDMTRILGMGSYKHPLSTNAAPPLTAQPTVVRLPLTADVQQLVIVSPGMGALASPTQCALCLHYYAQFCAHQQELRQAAERLGGVAVQQGTPVRVARDNVTMLPHERPAASFLVVRALGLLAERIRTGGMGEVHDVSDLQNMSLGCVRSTGALQFPAPTSRLALYNDLSAVVVQLKWPSSQGSFHSIARSTLLGKLEVQRRWDLVRMWCEYRRARRRVILHAWWDAVAQTLKAGTKRARMLEQKLWQEQNLTVKVSPTGKVKDLATGRVLDYTELSSQLIGSGALARLQRGKPPCSTTRHSDASASATDVAAGTTPSISWYTDYHGVVQRLERLYKQRVGRAVVEDCLPDELGVALLGVQLNDQPSTSASTAGSGRTGGGGGNGGKDEDFYVNAGVAIRTLRDDIPNLFQEDLDYDIYREDIVFRDPRNVFRGIKNYRTIFWSLRFHGRIFFRHLYVEILSIWQPGDKQIKMRWKVHGIPRVPWETEGTFDGISTFKLDSHGKVYEHQVDNVIFRDNPPLRLPIFARINLVPGAVSNGGQPCPGACTEQRPSPTWWVNGFSWYRLYAAMLLSVVAVPGGVHKR